MDSTPHPRLAFGTQLRRYRHAAGLTQEELAERAHVSRRSISDLERGVAQRPHQDTVARVAGALALSAPETAALAQAARRRGPVPAPVLDATGAGGGGNSVPVAPLVGRAHELSLLDQHLAGAGPPLLLLAGEPGIGKTRLLRAAIPRALARGLRVLEGGCQRRGEQEPFAPLLGALRRHIDSQPRARLRTELQGCAWLVRLLPEFAGGPLPPLPMGALPPEQERRLMIEAVGRFLGNVAGPAGTLLALDDLQWAGPDAVDLLATLAWGAHASGLRVLGAYRDTEARPEDALSVTVADLAQARLAAWRQVGPLSSAEAGALLDAALREVAGQGWPWGGGVVTAGARERALRRAGGVPFFLVSCAQALARDNGDEGGEGEGDIAREDAGAGATGGKGAEAPWEVAHSVRQRVAALPADAREALGVAAVIGREAPRALLVAVGAWPPEQALRALEAACQARLLEEAGAGAYRFAHDVVHEVIAADLSAGRRALLHGQVALALEQEAGLASGPGAALEALAYHYARSEARDKAALYLERAGDAARARHANAAADDYYREAAARLEGLGRSVDAARVREKEGLALVAGARYEAALAALEGAAEAYRGAGDLEGAARVLSGVGEVHGLRGTPEEGVARLRPMLQSLEVNGPSHGLSTLYAALAFLLFVCGRYDEQVVAAERAAHLAQAVGDELSYARAELSRGVALELLSRDALPVLTEAVRLLEGAGDLAFLCLALGTLARIHVTHGEFDTARQLAERAVQVAEQVGDHGRLGVVLSQPAHVAFCTGEWDNARATLERAIPLTHEISASGVAVFPLLEMGRLCLARGAWDDASRYLEEGRALAERSQDLESLRVVSSLLAEWDLLEGRPDAAVARLAPLLDRPGLEESDVTISVLPRLAWARLELGDLAGAAAVVTKAISRARARDYRLALVDALWVQAMIAVRRRRQEEAVPALDEALTLSRNMPYPYAEARLLSLYGSLHVHNREQESARERLEAAHAIFRRLGAATDAERVEQAIAGLGLP